MEINTAQFLLWPVTLPPEISERHVKAVNLMGAI